MVYISFFLFQNYLHNHSRNNKLTRMWNSTVWFLFVTLLLIAVYGSQQNSLYSMVAKKKTESTTSDALAIADYLGKKLTPRFRRLETLMNSMESRLMQIIQQSGSCRDSTGDEITDSTEDEITDSPDQYSTARTDSKHEWKQHGVTVAGGNERGDETNQLDRPFGIFVDDDQMMYIADHWNSRIIQWKRGEQRGRIIAGGNGEGNGTDQLWGPTDVVVEKRNNALIIADDGNRRVLRWSIQNKTKPQVLVSDINCLDLSIAKDGSIYIADHVKNEVRRWKEGMQHAELVAGGNGQGSGLNQFNESRYIFVDDDYSVYVSDKENHRVMKWVKGAKEGIVVAGGNGEGNSVEQLGRPQGVTVDQSGQIYVADWGNDRVMRWSEGNAEGEIVVGGNGEGQNSDQFDGPTGLTFDAEGNLYVVDHYNDRVQRFEKDFD